MSGNAYWIFLMLLKKGFDLLTAIKRIYANK